MTTSSYQPEKRRYHRIIFKDPKKIAALISPFDQQEMEDAAAASILNMSEGGIQMSVEKEAAAGLWRGREIMLHGISGLPDLAGLTEVPMQVVWIIENEFLDHVLIGTAFQQLSDQQQQSLSAFVHASLALDKERRA
ncbi:PilZ domain-containing protein [Candidatus Electronema halotolerans]|jgi:c-di-GMP-binding flagellar brake protein YcgR